MESAPFLFITSWVPLHNFDGVIFRNGMAGLPILEPNYVEVILKDLTNSEI